MSTLKFQGSATGTGSVTFAAPVTNSTQVLSVPDATATMMAIDSAGAVVNSSGVVNFGAGQFYKDASGNIGIGTTAPGYKLDVNGTFRATGTMGLPTAAGTNEIKSGTGDGASQSTYNIAFKSWYGLAFQGFDNTVSRVLDCRSGAFQSFVGGTGTWAPEYSGRVWGNFSGSGSIATRGTGNVSSIARNGTGNYTVNFSSAMPDGNYSAVVTTSSTTGTQGNVSVNNQSVSVQNTGTTSFGITVGDNNTDSSVDAAYVAFAVFR